MILDVWNSESGCFFDHFTGKEGFGFTPPAAAGLYGIITAFKRASEKEWLTDRRGGKYDIYCRPLLLLDEIKIYY